MIFLASLVYYSVESKENYNFPQGSNVIFYLIKYLRDINSQIKKNPRPLLTGDFGIVTFRLERYQWFFILSVEDRV